MTAQENGGGGLRPHLLFLDFETRSEVDIAECGSFRYIEDPSFEVLLLAYAFDNEPVKLVDFAQGETWPEEFLTALDDPEVTCIAHNCAFEREVIRKELGYTPPENWFDTMHLTAHCGLPLSLGKAGAALGLGEDQAKMAEGKLLIRYFCKPAKATKTNGGRPWNLPEHDPVKWETFRAYCAQDVVTMRVIFHMLERWMPDETERKLWCLDARINERGVRADLPFVRHAMEMDAAYKGKLTEEAIAISGLENPKSVSQAKAWLKDQEGIEVPSLNKKVVADVMAELKTEKAKQFMTIRSELSKTSTKKYDAFLRCACQDEHVRGCFQFFGGHTGRFTGKLVQLQNLKKNAIDDLDDARWMVRSGDYGCFKALYPNVSDTLSQLVRTSLIAEPGERFIVADFSAIEARISAWIAGEDWVLDVFRKGGDIYCAAASQMFGVPVEKNGINGHLRAKGKIATLALGYGGGVNALKQFGADKMGMTNEEMVQTIDLWRKANPRIVSMWYSMSRAMTRCIVHRATTVDKVGGIRFRWDHGIVWMRLPSGREMAYYKPEYGESRIKSDKRNAISYMGIDQHTKKWTHLETHGGPIFENFVQATARDCLRDTMLRLEAEGWDIRAHIHDEVICSEPYGGRSVEDMCKVFAVPVDWAPDLPLRGDGYETEYYKKD